MQYPVLSGAIHYFRVHPAYWQDRLLKLKACGYNTVETYVPWNFHEPKEGKFNFEGFAHIEGFIQTAAALDLQVIVRPGPYICAEWEYGGFPGWLNKDRNMRLRCNWPPFLEKVKNWFQVLIPKLTPYLASQGGPIVAMQVENEYGSFGNDKAYLAFIENLLKDLGVDCLLFTSDGWQTAMLEGGTLPHLWKTVNFGSKATEAFAVLRKFQPEGPDMCCEYWCGWFDHWGKKHHTRDPKDVAENLELIIKDGGSVNMYMFHGGTNFGFWNGANAHQVTNYEPTTTSYDYHALLSEAGDITPAYTACKAVLEKYHGKAPDIPVANTIKKAYGEVTLQEFYPLWGQLGTPVHSAAPLSMEELDQEYGYVLYRKTVDTPMESGELKLNITGFNDRAIVFVDGVKVGILYRNNPDENIILPQPTTSSFQLDILVENMGRVNYGPYMTYPCGIYGNIRLGYQALFGWDMYPLPLDKGITGDTSPTTASGPGFYRGTFTVDTPHDTFLDMKTFGKGVAFVNGFNLGRYWEIGPTQTMYIPGPLLHPGENELVIFETDLSAPHPAIELVAEPKLGHS